MDARDAEATAYRSGLDAAADDARNTIADAEAKLKDAENYTRPAVVKAEKAYQNDRLKRAKAQLAKVEKAITQDDADNAPSEPKAKTQAAKQPAKDQTA